MSDIAPFSIETSGTGDGGTIVAPTQGTFDPKAHAARLVETGLADQMVHDLKVNSGIEEAFARWLSTKDMGNVDIRATTLAAVIKEATDMIALVASFTLDPEKVEHFSTEAGNMIGRKLPGTIRVIHEEMDRLVKKIFTEAHLHD